MLNYRNFNIVFVVALVLFLVAMGLKFIAPIYLLFPLLVYVSVLIVASANIQWNFYVKSVNRLEDQKRLLLTFDDGPHPEFTLPLLNLLDEYQVKAIFFVIGKQVEKHPELVREMVSRGHIVGNHSHTHGSFFDFASVPKMVEEIQKTNDLISDIIGEKPVFFRPPYGVTNPRIQQLVSKTGMKSVGWSFRSFDTTSRSNDKIMEAMIKNIKGGEILLFHDRMARTFQILEKVLPLLNKQFVLNCNKL